MWQSAPPIIFSSCARGASAERPLLWQGALEGVTRAVVLELAAKLRIKAAEEPMTRYDVYTADEAFMTGTAAEIVPVISLDGRSIGSGKPGPVTAKLLAGFKALTASEGARIPKA